MGMECAEHSNTLLILSISRGQSATYAVLSLRTHQYAALDVAFATSLTVGRAVQCESNGWTAPRKSKHTMHVWCMRAYFYSNGAERDKVDNDYIRSGEQQSAPRVGVHDERGCWKLPRDEQFDGLINK